MTGNYDTNINGIRVSEWFEDDEDEPSVEFENAELEECYYDSWSGKLHVSVIAEDRGVYIDIPVVASNDWNEFVDALPRWE